MKDNPSKFRVTVATLIVACVLYFIGGGAAAWIGWFSTDKYVQIGGIVGGLASALGLFSLARPSLNQDDLRGLELQSLKRIAEASEEIQKLESARSATKEQIGTLEEQKRQMEFLVQKASLSLFLKEQHKLYEKRILAEISRNSDLSMNLAELSSINERLTALENEIEKDPNVDLLRRIIEAENLRPARSEFSGYPPLTRTFLLTVRELVEMVSKTLKL